MVFAGRMIRLQQKNQGICKEKTGRLAYMQALDGNTQQKILLVEDDTEISDMLKNFLDRKSVV